MRKNKIKIITISIFCFIIIALLVFLLSKTNSLQNKIKMIAGEDMIDITPHQKEFDFRLFQESLIQNIDKQEEVIVPIYVKKNIEILEEQEDGIQNLKTETIKKLEGNGIIITNDGYIITNKHVVQEKNSEYSVIINQEELLIDKIWFDNGLDIAVLKIKVKESLTPAKIIKIEENTKIGQIVFALKKDPEIKETIVKMGIINSKNQKFKIEDNNIYVGLIKNSTAIEPGFSGGPLIDLNGEVIGINTAIDNIEYGASYALPISQEFVNQTISSIKESNKIIRPWIGIKYQEHNAGIEVIEVEELSPAFLAGVEPGDIIYGINNIPINYNIFLYQLYTYKTNKQIILNAQKGNHKQDIQVSLGIKPN